MSRHGAYGEPPADPDQVREFVARNDLATTLHRRGLIVRDRWWRRPPRYWRDGRTVSPPEQVLAFFTDHVIAEIGRRGVVERRPSTLRDLEPLPIYLSGIATGLLFVIAIVLIVGQLT